MLLDKQLDPPEYFIKPGWMVINKPTGFVKMSYKSNLFFIVAVAGSIGLQILFMEIPALSVLLELTTVHYGMLFALLGISLMVLVVCEIYKLIIRIKENKKLDKKTM